MKFNKIWGSTIPIFTKNNTEIHRIEIVPLGFCSKHSHRFKYNMFYIESGKLEVRQWQKDSELIDRTILSTGEQTIVSPGILHQFYALEKTIAYEVYWTALEGEDIVRETTGGIDLSTSFVEAKLS